jgi:hypothetical protein
MSTRAQQARRPHFLQEYGYAAWEPPPREDHHCRRREDRCGDWTPAVGPGFLPVPPGTSLAVDGDEGSITSELAQRTRKKLGSMTMTRSSLIKKGIIYAAALGRGPPPSPAWEPTSPGSMNPEQRHN